MPQRQKHILIADDDEVLCDLLQLLLVQEGYSVVVARDGDEALLAIEAKRPDLILLDIMIPGLSGFDLLRKLQANQFFREIPVVMLSARSGERDQVQAFDFGAADFIAKPFRVEDLGKRIKRVLSRTNPEFLE
jgi:two-component system, OmpR family, phosphate regulon response regulator PhoB